MASKKSAKSAPKTPVTPEEAIDEKVAIAEALTAAERKLEDEITCLVRLPREILIPVGGGRMHYKYIPREHADPTGTLLRFLAVVGRAGNDHATQLHKGRTEGQARKRDIESIQYLMKLAAGETGHRSGDEVLKFLRGKLKAKPEVDTDGMKDSKMDWNWVNKTYKDLGKDPEAVRTAAAAKVEEINKITNAIDDSY